LKGSWLLWGDWLENEKIGNPKASAAAAIAGDSHFGSATSSLASAAVEHGQTHGHKSTDTVLDNSVTST